MVLRYRGRIKIRIQRKNLLHYVLVKSGLASIRNNANGACVLGSNLTQRRFNDSNNVRSWPGWHRCLAARGTLRVSTRDHHHNRCANIGGDPSIKTRLGWVSHIGEIGADNDHRIALALHRTILLDDDGQSIIRISVNIVIGHPRALLIAEVDIVMVEKQL